MTPPLTYRGRLRLAGPGLLVAATGIGAGDLVTGLVAGGRFGLTFAWAVVLGAVLKLALTEGVGRWHLATGTSIVTGWHRMGRWATGYFGAYSLVFGLIFGAAVTSASALPLNALMPAVPVPVFAIANALIGFVIISFGRYRLLERTMTILVGVMGLTILVTAARVLPSVGWSELVAGLAPRVPNESVVYLLGLVGGVGGTIILVAYGYWLQAKGWRGTDWLPVMRVDAAVAYSITAVFALALLILGAALAPIAGQGIDGAGGLVGFSDQLGQTLGEGTRLVFLIGFWATAFTSILGAWSGVSFLFADLVRVSRGRPETSTEEQRTSPAYRAYLAWITFPPMLLLFLDRPVGLVLAYAAVGALFMPFLAATLLWLLHRHLPDRRNPVLSTVALAGCVALFGVLAANELAGLF